jgi:UDP-N-acetylmuramate: L-alanyl-gamma-D-glutamyl-meso-diaminopimelate ligase
MGGIAAIAAQAGYKVTGCDAGVYPPMSDQLAALGIDLIEGFDADQLGIKPDYWVVGNVVSRGNPLMEAILDSGQAYMSGPQWLYEHVLSSREVIAVAGTHGKTTTTAMLRHILIANDVDAGWLVGGVPSDGSPSAGTGSDRRFVIEADEYDTAFFDKRSKFVHYRPKVAVLNNLEFDHADIFDDLAAIQTQFHHLVRTIAGNGTIIRPAQSEPLDQVLDMGVWTPVETVGEQGHWQVANVKEAGDVSRFTVIRAGKPVGECALSMAGSHNRANALAAIAAANATGIKPAEAIRALNEFPGVKRRLEVRGVVNDVTVIDDFAHHPTAIELTIAGLRSRIPSGRILAVIEPRSNTMRSGVMKDRLGQSVANAQRVYCLNQSLGWDVDDVFAGLGDRFVARNSVPELVQAVLADASAGDQVLVMSNGGFGGIHQQILDGLATLARGK